MTTYTVVTGDSLGEIARRHGTTVEAIRAANAELIVDIDVLQPGWKLTIPGDAAVESTNSVTPAQATAAAIPLEYVVQSGDSLSVLAATWGTTVAVLQEMNDIPDPDLLRAGQVLLRPARGNGARASGANDEPVRRLDEPAPPGELRFTVLPLAMPPGRINGVYLEQYPNGTHMGYDLGGVRIGTPIFAPAGGITAIHRPNDGTGFDSFGICVIIDHPGTPYWSIYAHLDSTAVENGMKVKAGDMIGRLGWTGFVDPPNEGGAHLHWQVSNNRWFPKTKDATRDPTEFLFGVEMPGVDDIPVLAGDTIGTDGELGGPDSPPDDGIKPGFEAFGAPDFEDSLGGAIEGG